MACVKRASTSQICLLGSLLSRVPESIFLFTTLCNLSSCLPFLVFDSRVTRSPRRSIQYFKLGDTVFRAIRHKENRDKYRDKHIFFNKAVPESLSGCRHFIAGYRDTYLASFLFGLLSGSVHLVFHLRLSIYKIISIIVQSLARALPNSHVKSMSWTDIQPAWASSYVSF